MNIGRAEATLIADLIDAQQRALGRALTREEMNLPLKVAEDTAVDSMRCAEVDAYERAGDPAKQVIYTPPGYLEYCRRNAPHLLQHPNWCRCVACEQYRAHYHPGITA